ncbi:MAG: methylated-DNA--[protein]-cysteine S-methyltransferase [Candidatus Limimorpha sp.]
MPYFSHYPSPLGDLTLDSDGEHLIGLWFNPQKYHTAPLHGNRQEKNLPVFEQTRQWLDLYFNSRQPDFLPPLQMEGSGFRKAVWEILLGIPYGSTMTYGDIAQEIARQRGLKAMSAQAVGGAVGHNPISIIVPCHRVVGSNGSLTGYASGIDKKIKLLKIEKVDMSHFFIPRKGTAL